jgi:hypothetical protein
VNPGRGAIESVQMVFHPENLASDSATRGENAVSAHGAAHIVKEWKSQLRGRNETVALIRDNVDTLQAF